MICAGELTVYVSIERDLIVRESGIERKTPQILFSAWAKPEPIRGNEYWRNQQVNVEADWKFTMRYAISGQVKASDRVLMGSRRFEIRAIFPDEMQRDFVVLMCRSING